MGKTRVACLGASAGGLQALEAFFDTIPPDTGLAFVVVVHLSPDFKSVMAELLARRTQMPVATAEEGHELRPDHVYVIPPAMNLRIVDDHLVLDDQEREARRGLHLPIDILFRSLAAERGETSIAVVLSGTGSDGSRGLHAVKEVGGLVLTQTPETSRFDGMPRSALMTGLVDYSGDPAQLAERIGRFVDEEDRIPEVAESPTGVDAVLRKLRAEVGLDFSCYRPRMVSRRIRRRMALRSTPTIEAYRNELDSPEELDALRQDLLVGVTGFFRDRSVFERLRNELSATLGSAGSTDIRVWVPACSAGHEAYTLAILLLEAMSDTARFPRVKIFATDVNRDSIERAARGVYTLSEISDLPLSLVSKYFQQKDTLYTVRNEVRELVIFAYHNTIVDPPFTRMDLVSCRNLLIYLEPETQKRVLQSLVYALRPDSGMLLLGVAENPGPVADALTPIDKRSRLYRKTGEIDAPEMLQFSRDPTQSPSARRKAAAESQTRLALASVMELTDSTCALVTTDGHLMELVADPHQVFRLSAGRVSTELNRLLPPSILTAFSAAQARLVRSEEASVMYRVQHGGLEFRTHLVRVRDGLDSLLVFQMTPTRELPSVPLELDEASRDRILELEGEVRVTRDALQATIEELQSTNEEQQATNEELVAANEELQSTNEELHSVNQELFTVNAELQQRNDELQVMTADLDNLLSSIDVGTLYLDNDLRIRKFTRGIERVLRLVDYDIGRPVVHYTHSLDYDYIQDVRYVVETQTPISREVRLLGGGWLLMRVRPYQREDESDGVIVTFVDVTRLKTAEEAARAASTSLREANVELEAQAEQLEEMFSIIAHDLRRPVLVLDGMLTLATEEMDGAETPPDASREHVHSAHETVTTLRELLKDLTMVSRQSREPIEVESVELRSWLDALLAPFSQRLEASGARLNRVCDSGTVSFARAAGAVAITNLVENAIKYGTAGPNPEIDVSCRKTDTTLHIVVSDNGPGIPRDDHDRVFELFRQLDPDQPGSGVGLVAARRVVQRVGGQLSLRSVPGEGARFDVHLPIDSQRRTPRLLHVEDDELDASTVKSALSAYAIDRVATCAAATDRIRQGSYDLALIDFSLPDGHGLSLLPDLRNAEIPAVLVTGLDAGLSKDMVDTDEVLAVIGKDEIVSGRLATLLDSWLPGTSPQTPD